jgi:hypothetical protein
VLIIVVGAVDIITVVVFDVPRDVVTGVDLVIVVLTII